MVTDWVVWCLAKKCWSSLNKRETLTKKNAVTPNSILTEYHLFLDPYLGNSKSENETHFFLSRHCCCNRTKSDINGRWHNDIMACQSPPFPSSSWRIHNYLRALKGNTHLNHLKCLKNSSMKYSSLSQVHTKECAYKIWTHFIGWKMKSLNGKKWYHFGRFVDYLYWWGGITYANTR